MRNPEIPDGHASKFVPPGSTGIGSNITGSLQNVAFLSPAAKKNIDRGK